MMEKCDEFETTTKKNSALIDLLNVLDCTTHEFFIFKLIAYDFDKISLNLILSFLRIRTHSTEVDSAFWEILSGTLLFVLYNCNFLF